MQKKYSTPKFLKMSSYFFLPFILTWLASLKERRSQAFGRLGTAQWRGGSYSYCASGWIFPTKGSFTGMVKY